MRKSLLFPTMTLFILAASTVLSPRSALGEQWLCNNKVCTDLGGGWAACLEETAGPNTVCWDTPTSCSWDWCGSP
jgi:hypothetical protein